MLRLGRHCFPEALAENLIGGFVQIVSSWLPTVLPAEKLSHPWTEQSSLAILFQVELIFGYNKLLFNNYYYFLLGKD